MTTVSEATEALYQLFSDTWTPTGYQFTYDNEEFEPPVDEPWARFSIRHSGFTQETLGGTGNRKFQRTGRAFTQVFVPVDSGRAEATSLAETVLAAVEGERLSGTTLYFTDCPIREIGPDGKWYQVVLEANFAYDDEK